MEAKAYDMKTREIADLLGVTGQTVYNWANRGRLPACYILGARTRRWNREEVLEWLEARRIRREYDEQRA